MGGGVVGVVRLSICTKNDITNMFISHHLHNAYRGTHKGGTRAILRMGKLKSCIKGILVGANSRVKPASIKTTVLFCFQFNLKRRPTLFRDLPVRP